MLAVRKGAILKIIVGEYISTAMPVASESIARSYAVGVSPATVRLDMASLAEEGFILRPHPSAGGMPSDKGYRYYVEYLKEPRELPSQEQRLIQHLFYQLEKEAEEWLKLTAAILGRLSGNVAVVTYPKNPYCQLKHVELVALHELKALLVLVLSQAQLRQRIFSLDRPVTQEELGAIAHRLNQAYEGRYAQEIAEQELPVNSLEENLEGKVTRLIIKVMEAEEAALGEAYITGLANLLGQPDFSPKTKLSQVVDAVEARTWLPRVAPVEKGIKVVIGQENQEEALRSCSLILSRYGIPRGAGGVVGVVGPTRMRYGQVMSSVHYLSNLLSRLMEEYYA